MDQCLSFIYGNMVDKDLLKSFIFLFNTPVIKYKALILPNLMYHLHQDKNKKILSAQNGLFFCLIGTKV